MLFLNPEIKLGLTGISRSKPMGSLLQQKLPDVYPISLLPSNTALILLRVALYLAKIRNNSIHQIAVVRQM